MQSESMPPLWCEEEILRSRCKQFRSLASEGRPHLLSPRLLLPGSHAQLVFFSLLSCNCSSVLGNRGRKSQSFRRATMTIKQRWGREEESVSAGDERMRGGLAKEKGGRWRSAGPAEVEMKGKAVGRRDGVGDGSKRLSLLTSFSWKAESEGKGRSGAFILWMQGWSWLMRAANTDTHTHCSLSLSLSLTHTHTHTSSHFSLAHSLAHTRFTLIWCQVCRQNTHSQDWAPPASSHCLPSLFFFFSPLVSNCSWEAILPKLPLIYKSGSGWSGV